MYSHRVCGYTSHIILTPSGGMSIAVVDKGQPLLCWTLSLVVDRNWIEIDL